MKAFRHPVLALSGTKRGLLFVGAFVLMCIFWYALQRLDVLLETPAAHWGIVSLELAGTPERSREIIESWNVAARDNAQSGLLLDFLFPLCYSTTLTIACFWAAGLFRDRGYRKTGWLAGTAAWAQWPAAAFDYVENCALWMELRGSIQDPWPRLARTCASIKFLLVALGLCTVISAAVIWILRRRACPPTDPGSAAAPPPGERPA